MKNLKLVSATAGTSRAVVRVGDVEIGRGFTVIAGPCSVESEAQTLATARAAAALCDADQALAPAGFAGLMSRVRPLVGFMEASR